MEIHSQSSLFNETISYERICDLNTLRAAYKAVRSNGGSPGVDQISVEEFGLQREKNLTQLRKELQSWTYKPQPVKRVLIPKPCGKKRPLGIPTVRDRVVQTAIKLILEPHYDPTFSSNSYGFRPGRSQKDALLKAKEIANEGKEWVVDLDLEKFFDRIQHDRLIHRLGIQVEDKGVLRLIGETLRSGVMESGLVTVPEEGSVQGSPLSPLLSNIVLDELDKELEKRGHSFCRFADDVNIFVKTPRAGERVLKSITVFIERKLKLRVNKTKTQVALTSAVKFLGMTIIAGSLLISKVSLDRAMEKVKELTPRSSPIPVEKTIAKVNSWYRGWSGYYLLTEYPSQLGKIEAHVRRRLRAQWLRQKKRDRFRIKGLVKMGVSKKHAFNTILTNRKIWALSHTRGVEKALSNRWFINQKRQWIRSKDQLPHWKPLKNWVKLV